MIKLASTFCLICVQNFAPLIHANSQISCSVSKIHFYERYVVMLTNRTTHISTNFIVINILIIIFIFLVIHQYSREKGKTLYIKE